MGMRRLAILSVCLLALVPAFDAAAATSKGTVERSWISTTSGGASGKQFSAGKVKRLYANFTWKTPATPGQDLAIEWHDPAGALRARWKDKTIKADKKGTRLYAWIALRRRQGQGRHLEGSAHRRRQGDQHLPVPRRSVSFSCA